MNLDLTSELRDLVVARLRPFIGAAIDQHPELHYRIEERGVVIAVGRQVPPWSDEPELVVAVGVETDDGLVGVALVRPASVGLLLTENGWVYVPDPLLG